ncbi:hypothetical protein BDA96_02G147400 [Sorghum bicolor]|uniref:Uncharacterized protein n=2 Tax=Sorghum bicolor TaxID=4558 RepID=A0A921RPN7_SORBI|nr:hypothetical protein BDA96_02G147400 [Sorghum bicolor]KXG35166.1 hypothetical protein SORBI_3002G141800 [Sorghum bicolor]
MSTTTTNAVSQQKDAADKKPAQETVTKTVQTVEVRSSAGQPDEEGVLKPVKVVHEIPAKEAKDNSGVKQD